ncbi:leucine-rich repeat domain-containing protein [Treponema saccharophilum]|uniref:Surface antigen BspA n=2 Tax=Treponema saccharophilum DSM 2985 TaxID=907348 RepID=H7EJU4_9SPIR|nr:leucine-rich repeat domain-containing protein [Treponema saccharophilum]EIC02214.1 hypothetical protein TresaDRAFT_2194 [Treponema saccharophilum DSM 2985]BDC96662.1 hypothetical protein TRSA_17610 [Treponema saccharophilum]
MSAGYGYFKIEFYTGDGSADADAAKRAYDWCKENYGWFRGEEGDGSDAPFLLDGNKFKANEDVCIDPGALDIKYGDVPDNTAWLQKPFKAVKAARLVASLYQDFGESGWECHEYREDVWQGGGLHTYYGLPEFNRIIFPSFYGEKHIDNIYEYNYRPIMAKFKNKKTGEEILSGNVTHDMDDDEIEQDSVIDGTVNVGGARFPVEIGEGYVCLVDGKEEEAALVKAFVSALKKAEGYADTDEADWEFCDFCSKRGYFDLYGSNPPIPQYTTLAVNSDGSAHIYKGEAVPHMKEDEADGRGKTVVLEAKDFDGYEGLRDEFDKNLLDDATVVIRGVKGDCLYFKETENLKSVILEDDVEEIGEAFEDCTALSSVVIGAGVTRIGGWAFKGCKSLASIKIGAGVTNIGIAAFDGCKALSSVEFGGTMAQWDAVLGKVNLFDGDVPATGVKCADGVWQRPVLQVVDGVVLRCSDKSAASVEIPAGVTKIGDQAFSGCKALASVVIPDSVTKIGWYAFRDCTSLASVVIPDSVTEIGGWAFSGCKALASVVIPDSVTKIGEAAFSGCESLASIKIGTGVTKIGEAAFQGCTVLASMVIGAGVTEIDVGEFSGCKVLASVEFGGTVAQWEAVKKWVDWHGDVPAKSVKCSDGEAEL